MSKRAKRAIRNNPREERNSPDYESSKYKKNKRTRQNGSAQTNSNVVSLDFSKARKKSVEIVPRSFNQEDLLVSLEDDKKPIVFAIGPAGSGKAQPLYSKILTPSGWVRMEELSIGDYVSTPEGSSAPITGIFPQGQKEIYKVHFKDGRIVECCKEHLWNVYQYHWKEKWRVMSLEDIMNNPLSRNYKVQLIENKFDYEVENMDLIIDPYVMGILLGDGCLNGNMSISTADSFIKEKVESFLGDDYYLKCIGKYDYGIRNKNNILEKTSNYKNKFTTYFREEKLLGVKSCGKYIPKEYMDLCYSQKISLIQGLLDSDGTVDKGGHISFCTISEQLAKDVTYLIRSIGGIAKISTKQTSYTHNGQKRNGQISYNVSIRYKNPRELFSLPRKLKRISDDYQYSNDLKLEIIKIEKYKMAEAQCIMIDSDSHLYITDDFIVTHNTMIATLHAIKSLKEGKIDKIVISRPNVAVDDKDIGFLPGGIMEKMAPWVRPIIAEMEEYFSKSEIEHMVKEDIIEIIPVAYLRGRTFKNSIILLDEAQNTTPSSLLSAMTRIGENSKMIITGDIKQSDRSYTRNGLADFVARYESKPSLMIDVIRFTHGDVQRHPVIKDILNMYPDIDE